MAGDTPRDSGRFLLFSARVGLSRHSQGEAGRWTATGRVGSPEAASARKMGDVDMDDAAEDASTSTRGVQALAHWHEPAGQARVGPGGARDGTSGVPLQRGACEGVPGDGKDEDDDNYWSAFPGVASWQRPQLCEGAGTEPGAQQAQICEASDEPALRASPTFGIGQPALQDVSRQTPPPSGTTFDHCDLECEVHARSGTRQERLAASAHRQSPHGTERARRQEVQLHRWRALLRASPHDELACFWREQVNALEALLMEQQRAGVKRAAVDDDEWSHKYSRMSIA